MPAPNEHYIPSWIGPKVPYMYSSTADSIFGKRSDYERETSAGPEA
jgi:hypothetical protein